MSIRDRFPQAKLPRSHYFLTISRGEKVRAFAVRPALAMAALAAAPLFAPLGLRRHRLHRLPRFRRDGPAVARGAVAERLRGQAQRRAGRNRARVEPADARPDRLRRQDARSRLASGQAGEPRRGAGRPRGGGERQRAGASRHAPARRGQGRQRAGGAPGHRRPARRRRSRRRLGAASAYAPAAATQIAPLAPAPAQPAKPRPLDGDQASRAAPAADRLAGELAAAAADASLDPNARVGLVGYSLDRVERAQLAALDRRRQDRACRRRQVRGHRAAHRPVAGGV